MFVQLFLAVLFIVGFGFSLWWLVPLLIFFILDMVRPLAGPALIVAWLASF